jgi:hypothetical protein
MRTENRELGYLRREPCCDSLIDLAMVVTLFEMGREQYVRSMMVRADLYVVATDDLF